MSTRRTTTTTTTTIKELDLYSFEKKIQNYLILGGHETGRSRLCLNLLNKCNLPVIGIFTKDNKTYNNYVSKSLIFNEPNKLYINDVISNQKKNNFQRTAMVIDDASDNPSFISNISKSMSLNRISRISFVMCSTMVPKIHPSEKYNMDWIFLTGGMSSKQYQKIYDDYGMCFKRYEDYIRLIRQLDERPRGSISICFKGVYDKNFTDPGPYFVPISNTNYIPPLAKKITMNKLGNCSICFDELDDDIVYLPCKHLFHWNKCLKIWANKRNTCPSCRHKFLSKDIRYVD